MPNKTETDSVGTIKGLSDFAGVPADLIRNKIAKYLDVQSTMLFSGTCKAVRDSLFDVREKHNLNSLIRLLGEIRNADRDLFKRIIKTNKHNHESLFAAVVRNNEVLTKQIAIKRTLLMREPIVLLAAVVQGNEDWAREILITNPGLILNKSATVRDLSGKLITGLTPLQAAICAGDVEMIQMMKEVLRQRVRAGVTLSFDPEAEIARQFAEIYTEGIDAVETAQKDAADKFKKSILKNLFNAINAATADQVRYELDHPGQELNNPDEKLNEALCNFRKYFADRSNAKQIFNPYDLLEAFKLFDKQFDAFNGKPNSEEQWDRRRLFWRQVIGYIQRHLPACYWQAFAQGIYCIVENNEKLERSFELKYGRGYYMRAVVGSINSLGYKFASEGHGGASLGYGTAVAAKLASKLIANKKIRIGELMRESSSRPQPQNYLQSRCVIS